MFSYLRPHRRTPSSNPTSPALPEGLHAWGEPSPLQFSSSSDHAHSPRLQNDSPQERMSASSPPPVLPPIANLSFSSPTSPPEYNVESTKSRQSETNQQSQARETLKEKPRPQEAPEYSNFKRPYATEQRPYSAGRETSSSRFTSFDQLGSAPAGDKKEKKGSKQRSPDSSTGADIQPLQKTGRRPTGTRLPTPPPEKQAQVSKFEPVQSRSGKARLNLLNPMSLLARRRTSQAVAQLTPVSIVSSKGSSSSGSFDPRIRGTVVHDFSAPRPRRNLSSGDIRSPDNSTTSRHYHRSPSGQYGGLSGTDESVGSPWSGGNHTPVFTENFEEEQYPAAGPHVRKASDISDLPLPKPPYANGFQKRPEQNTTQSAHTTEKQVDTKNVSLEKPEMDIGPPVPPKNEPELPAENKRISIDPSSTPPKSSPSKKGRSRNVSEVSARELSLLGLPKHMKSTKSTSSRFSFDMLGAAEQEKILEDRHREKALRKKNASEEGNDYGDEEDDEYDYDNMDDDDGLEERIPGVNADFEEENFDDLEENIPGVNVENDEDDGARLDDMENIAGFTFQQQVVSSLTSPMSPYSPGMASTPRDANGEVIGFAMTKESPYLHMNSPLYTGHQSNTSPGSSASPDLSRTPSKDHDIHGLGLHGVDVGQEQENEIQKSHSITTTTEFPRPASGIDDDDLYFDDGIIDLPDNGADHVEFDESVFDTIDTDQYGRPLKPFSTLSTLYEPPMLKETPMQPDQEKEKEEGHDSKDEESKDKKPSEETVDNKLSQETMDAIRAAFGAAVSPTSSTFTGALAPKPSVIGTKTSQGLTQDTLMAYQSALAAAAQAAEANGKFRRESISSEKEENQPSLVRDSGETFSGYEPFSPTYDDFDYDDALEDDPIIAAANAEALANDCDGFYGQEFGFYSAPAASEAQYANGGYFGPRGGEAVNRSQSGRIALREPNLTPITERSEYSNRNSFMSLQLHSPFPADLRSPGLAQLAMMHADRYGNDGDMSLDALIRLRNKAWGGSQASVHSSTGSPRGASPSCEETSSPMGQIPPWSGSALTSPAPAPVPNGANNHRRQNSTISLVSEERSPAASAPVSPTMTMSSPAAPGLASPLASPSEGNGDIRRTHKRGKSSDSISYLKEDDPVEGQRWVLERRRTAESGELECLREIVEGGRI